MTRFIRFVIAMLKELQIIELHIFVFIVYVDYIHTPACRLNMSIDNIIISPVNVIVMAQVVC